MAIKGHAVLHYQPEISNDTFLQIKIDIPCSLEANKIDNPVFKYVSLMSSF